MREDDYHPIVETEQGLCGILLFDNEVLDALNVPLKAEHFLDQFCGRLFATIQYEVRAGRAADPRTMSAALECNPDILWDWCNNCAMTSNANSYGKLILEAWQSRAVAEAIKGSYKFGGAGEAIEFLRKRFEAIEDQGAGDDDMAAASDMAAETLDEMEELALTGQSLGLMTGLSSFDDRVGGFVPGVLIVAAGISGMGKSLTGRSLLYRAATNNSERTFGYYSFEMTKQQLSYRTMSEVAFQNGKKIPYQAYYKPTQGMVDDLNQFRDRVPKNVKVAIRVKVGIDWLERSIRRFCRQNAAAGKPVAAVVVDHLHRMEIDQKAKDGRGDICRSLKNLAMDLGITVVLLAQMNREILKRDNKRPLLSDLKESGTIENEADVVLFPFREYEVLRHDKPKKGPEVDDWEAKLARCKNEITLIYGKVRMGQKGEDELRCKPAYDTLYERDPQKDFWDDDD